MPIVIVAMIALYLFTGDHLAEVEAWFGGHGSAPDQTPSAGPSVKQPPPSSAYKGTGIGAGIEGAIQGRTGVPVQALGEAAVHAPTWAKVIFPLPVLGTALAHKVLNHPVDTAKAIGTDIKKGAEAVTSTIGHAASGAASEIASWF
jgi:hypothetical protein